MSGPIISGIVKICKSFFKQLHDQYASPETWAKARETLASCPTQHDLSTAPLDHWGGLLWPTPISQTKLVHLFWSACQNGLIFYFVHHTGWAYEEQEEDPCVMKILNFLSGHNVAIPPSRRKLATKFMLEKLRVLKWLGASIPALSLSSNSSPTLTLSQFIVIHIPHQKDALLSHFAEVAEALSQSTTLITPPPFTTFSSRQK